MHGAFRSVRTGVEQGLSGNFPCGLANILHAGLTHIHRRIDVFDGFVASGIYIKGIHTMLL